MERNFKHLKNPKIIILLLLVIIVLTPFISYFLGRIIPPTHPNWSRRFSDIAQYSSFGLLKEKDVVEIEEKEEVEVETTNLVSVSPSEIDIINKRVSIYEGEMENTYMFSALLKNNSGYGIPKVVIKSIKIYDKNNNLIGEKTDYVPNASVTIVKEGEYPFSFEITKQKNDWNPESFDLEITIPEFEVNKKVVRLDIVSLEFIERVDKHTLGVIEKGGFKYLHYFYDVTIKNNTEEIVGDIYYISFLKHEDLVLSPIEDSCCTGVYFEKEQEPFSLDEPDVYSILQPGQEETIRIKMFPHYSLYEQGINEDKIEPVFYVIGLTK